LWFYYFCKDYTSIKNHKIEYIAKVSNINNVLHTSNENPLKKSSAIFNVLMNDLFNLKLMNLYCFNVDTTDVEKAVMNFSNKYFWSWNDICWEDSKYYLYPKKVDYTDPADKSMICSHPLTYKYLKEKLKEVLQLKNNLKLINSQWFDNLPENSLRRKAFSHNTSSNSTDVKNFYNILLNEYFWYSRWLNYYKFVIITKWGWVLSWIRLNEKFANVKFDYQKEADFINDELVRSWKAITMSIRILKNIERTFPIHIGLVAYFEDLINFRKKFVQLFTPFHQLYYKLRNVEDLDR